MSRKLEEGKPIKGMVGYILLTDHSEEEGYQGPVSLKVKCEGLDTSGCGIQVLISPVSGTGTLKISPCRWFDTPIDVAAHVDRINRVQQANDELTEIGNQKFLRNRRESLISALSTMGEKFQQDMVEDISERFNGKTIQSIDLSLTLYCWRVLLAEKFQITVDEVGNYTRW